MIRFLLLILGLFHLVCPISGHAQGDIASEPSRRMILELSPEEIRLQKPEALERMLTGLELSRLNEEQKAAVRDVLLTYDGGKTRAWASVSLVVLIGFLAVVFFQHSKTFLRWLGLLKQSTPTQPQTTELSAENQDVRLVKAIVRLQQMTAEQRKKAALMKLQDLSVVSDSQVRVEAAKRGLAHKAESIIRLRQPAWRLVKDKSLPVSLGGCKFGGAPHAPGDFAWPYLDGEPCYFMAQIRLSELAMHAEERVIDPIESDGLLLFFAPAEVLSHNEPGGESLVRLIEKLDDLQIIQPPVDSMDGNKEVAVTPDACWSLPTWDYSEWYDSIGWNGSELRSLQSWIEDSCFGGNRFLGFSSPIQYPVETEPPLFDGINPWQHLLTLSDSEGCWSYHWRLPPDDWPQRRFDRVTTSLQCT